jgi:hypothetical protein
MNKKSRQKNLSAFLFYKILMLKASHRKLCSLAGGGCGERAVHADGMGKPLRLGYAEPRRIVKQVQQIQT